MSKTFVLDTSVLLFDHNAITNFQENDIIIPIMVLEELDRFKVGNETKNFEARNVIRFLDKLSENKSLSQWISLGKGKGRIKIALNEGKAQSDAKQIFGTNKNDNRILNVALAAQTKGKKTEVILVTKDINLRIKAKAIGLRAQDYLTGKVDVSEVPMEYGTANISDLDASIIKSIYEKKRVKENGVLSTHKIANGYYVLNNCTQSALAKYNGSSDRLELVEKKYAYGIKPKNAEQTFALNALLDPAIKLVAVQGVAGTGKTLLALAAALEQKSLYDQIILSRPIIPLSNRDIGFLPGDANDKISPYMQPLFDNLKVIKSQFKENARKLKWIEEMQKSGDLSITALAFIRGRSLNRTIFIIDEAQNLTPHEIKTIITRAGEGTKIVFTGDVHQIDTPYLDEQSNGLSYIIDKLRGNPLFAHIRLEKGERSALANMANELL